MAVSFTIMPNTNYTQGTRNFGPFSIPAGLSVFKLSFSRNNWSNVSAKMKADVEVSMDGGSTWRHLAGFTSEGGDAYNDDGSLSSQTFMEIGLSNPNSTTRMLRATIVISGGNIRTTGTLEAY